MEIENNENILADKTNVSIKAININKQQNDIKMNDEGLIKKSSVNADIELLSKDIDNDEPILQDNPSRFVLFPIQNQKVLLHYILFVSEINT